MQKILFPNTSWWLLLLIPLTILGFYPSYFSSLLGPRANVYHIHAFFMSLWVIMSILQPFLIHYKKIRLHKLIGKISYVIVPLVFITGYMVIRHGYYLNITEEADEVAKGISLRSAEEINTNAASRMLLGTVYYLWLVIFYILAVINRKKVVFHATYMFAATLTVLGPTVDRLLYNVCKSLNVDYNFFIENSMFILISILLTWLIFYQRKNGYTIKPSLVALGIYVAGILAFFFLPDTRVLTSIFELLM